MALMDGTEAVAVASKERLLPSESNPYLACNSKWVMRPGKLGSLTDVVESRMAYHAANMQPTVPETRRLAWTGTSLISSR